MRDKKHFTIDVVSGIDDELVERHLKKRFALWKRRGKRNLMRWIPLVAALLCVCILTTTLLLVLPGEDVDTRQVPIYTGMTVSNDPPTALARAGELMQRTQMLSADGDEVPPAEEGTSGQGNTPDVSADTYYAMKNEDIYIHIHISNPDGFEILSFTLNGVKYSSYMFEDGSDMETLILKYNVGDVNGLQEYTIDAIKYVDGDQIKDVRMEGDRTVGVYVNDDDAALQFNATVSVDTITLAPTQTLLSLALYEGDTLIRELSPSDRKIKNLPLGKRLVLVATYDDGGQTETVRYTFDTPTASTGLEIEDGVIVGIGDCTDTVLYLNQPIAEKAFQRETRIRIKEVYLGSGVTSIGAYAFEDCDTLKTVVLPDGMTKLESCVFRSCNALKNVVLPDTLESVGEAAFSECASLTEIALPNSLTSIGTNAFSMCTALRGITLPERLTYLGSRAFSDTGLTELRIPSGMTEIPDGLLMNCGSLKSVTLHDDVTAIGIGAFENCSSLSEITLPEGLVTLRGSSFVGTAITEIRIPGTVTTIGTQAFKDCTSLVSVTLAEGVETIKLSAFENCVSLETVVLPDSVTSIEEKAFSMCAALKSITLPKRLTSLGAYAFSESGLTEIRIPSVVATIREFTFYNCRSLETIVLPDGLISIGAYAFSESGLTEIQIPSGVTTIREFTFYNCRSLETVVLPDSVTSIGKKAFSMCAALKSITLPKRLTSLGAYAFSESGLTEIQIPSGVTTIGEFTFYNCHSLETVVLPDSVTSIGASAFSESGLTEIRIPSGVTSIEAWTFNGCSSLTEIVLSDTLTSIGESAFSGCSSLTNIRYGGTVAQWSVIPKRYGWNSYIGSYTVYCNDGNITK